VRCRRPPSSEATVAQVFPNFVAIESDLASELHSNVLLIIHQAMFMRISRKASYGIQAVCQLAQLDDRDLVPSHQLAAMGDMPEKFLLEVLRSLVNAKVLGSQRGPIGGYQLTKSPSEITVLAIIEAVDGPLTDITASGERNEAERSESEPHAGFVATHVFAMLTKCARDVFSALTVSDLLAAHVNGRRLPEFDGQLGLALLPWPTHDGGWIM
jgi:Rrf2 family protein